jgi:hypothetical protein
MIDFPLARLQPEAAAIYGALGLRDGVRPSPRSAALLERALELFQAHAEPKGVSESITADEFAAIYAGQGLNALETPLQNIFVQAGSLRLFAFTLGEAVSAKIKELFAGDDFALGTVLDAVASLAADRAANVAEEWLENQSPEPKAGALAKAFLYSPGYCGWHISGQATLFARLRPDRIGITLNSSFLMCPLKSISGVLVAGPAAIHHFSGTYPFCGQCQSPACRDRGAARPE